jgi:acetylglutamate kinase
LGQIARLRAQAHEIVLVHGGGKSLSRRLEQLGIESRFVGGLRVTDDDTLRVALMVLAGEVNKSIVMELAALGTQSAGICGVDAASVRCSRYGSQPGCPQDLGRVGRPISVNKGFFDLLFGSGILPVVASIALADDNQACNVNADQMASACAWGTGSSALVYLTDVAGVLGPDKTVIPSLDRGGIDRLRASGELTGGMLPKTEACIEALDRGVSAIRIVPGGAPEILSRFIMGNLTEGTCIHGSH